MGGKRPGREPVADRPRIPSVYGVPGDAAGLRSWADVEERLAAARAYWLATAGGRGPHVRPVAGIWLDGALYLGGSPASRWVRNVDANPAVTIHLGDGFDVVIVEGNIEQRMIDGPLAERLAAASNAKEPEHLARAADYEGKTLRAVVPEVAFAWKAFPRDVTRFRFDDRND